MITKISVAALLAANLIAGAAFASEMPAKARAFGAPPKGSYSVSCTCAFSGGHDLMCYCNNLQAKMFATTLDVRQCPLPNDIKNCDGTLTCTQSPTTQCPSKN
jgi:hypothetical protein